MGCVVSGSISSYEYSKIIQRAEKYERQRIFDEIGLTDVDIDKLFKVFKKFDYDNSGKMELGELIANLGLEDSPYARRVFRLFDTDGSSDIDFKEFVLSLWNYCTLTNKTLIEFAFKLFDQDGDGLLRLCDMKAMMREIYGIKSTTDPKLIRMVQEFESKVWLSEVDAITCRQFGEFARNYQQLIFPAFQIQNQMREKVLGSSFWSIHTNYRVREVDGKVLDLPLKTRAYLTFSSPRSSPANATGMSTLAATPIFQPENLPLDQRRKSQQLASPRMSFTSTVASPGVDSRRSSRIAPVDTTFNTSESHPITPRGGRTQMSANLNQNPAPQWSQSGKSHRQHHAMPALQLDNGSPKIYQSKPSSRVASPRNSMMDDYNTSQRVTPRGSRIQVNPFLNQAASSGDTRPSSKFHTPTMQILSPGTGSIASPPLSARARGPSPHLPRLPLVQVSSQVTTASTGHSTARPSSVGMSGGVVASRRNSAPLVPAMSPANDYKVVHHR